MVERLYSVINKELNLLYKVARDLEIKLRNNISKSDFDVSITTFPGEYGILVTLPSSLRDSLKSPQGSYDYQGRKVPLAVVYY
ncbi:MAG: hypothetical protein LAT82_03700 [Nanoarchaeota archaeon]|nr:hypothetical protein [Nanoarchaeota archaeon]